MRTLIVDDSAESRLLIRAYLEEAGYPDCCEARNAAECYSLLDRAADGKERAIQLIILDILMPEPDGLAVLKRIKSNERHADIPVLMVTADQSSEKLSLAFAYGAADYMVKPLKRMELLARVRASLKLKEQIDFCRQRERELLTAAGKLKQANRQLRQMTAIDGLTGIANRRHFDEFLLEACEAIKETGVISLILLDVDCFKGYNDAYGHLQGDEALRQLAQALEGLTAMNQLASRYGGEEFALVAPSLGRKEALELAEKIRRAISSLALCHDKSPVAPIVTVSVGVVSAQAEQMPLPLDLISCADQAMYLSKQAGRNRVTSVEFAKNPNNM